MLTLRPHKFTSLRGQNCSATLPKPKLLCLKRNFFYPLFKKTDIKIKTLIISYFWLLKNCNHCKKVNNEFNKSMVWLLISCNTKKRKAQNFYIHNSNKNY